MPVKSWACALAEAERSTPASRRNIPAMIARGMSFFIYNFSISVWRLRAQPVDRHLNRTLYMIFHWRDLKVSNHHPPPPLPILPPNKTPPVSPGVRDDSFHFCLLKKPPTSAASI